MELTFDLPDDDDDDGLLKGPGMGGGGGSSYSELREGDVLRGQGGGEFVLSSDVPSRTGRSGNVRFGAVVASGVTVAIKVIDRIEIDGRPDAIKLLTRELNIKRKLRHPNLINLLDVAFDDLRAMLIMEMADGGTLFDLVSCGSPLPEGRARFLFKQILSAISYCHDLQIYHRNLKLENILLTSDGTDTLKIKDFGASEWDNSFNLPKARMYSMAYMAPEVTDLSRSDFFAEADIWSLGVILYVLTACNFPFGFDGPKRWGGIQAHKVYQNIRRGADSVNFPESMSSELVELLRGTTDVLVPPIDEVRWSIGRVRSCAWLQNPEVAEKRLALAKGLGGRLAADSPLLLLDMDAVHSIMSVLSQPCCVTLAKVHEAAATTMAALPTIPEIVWPVISGRDKQENTMFDDYLNFSLYQSLHTDGTPTVLQLGGGDGDGLDTLSLDDDDIGL